VRLLVEQLRNSLFYRWFAGLEVSEEFWRCLRQEHPSAAQRARGGRVLSSRAASPSATIAIFALGLKLKVLGLDNCRHLRRVNRAGQY
jgi:hypothetical protein